MRILFLCVANSVRSQMAEGLARHLFGDRAFVASAGTIAASVHPRAIEAMREVGIDISQHRSKSVDEIAVGTFDVIITLCDEDVCPVVPPHVTCLHWPVRNPSAGSLHKAREHYRETRDEISKKLETFGRERGLLSASPPA